MNCCGRGVCERLVRLRSERSKEDKEEDNAVNVVGGIEQEQVSHNIRVSFICVFAGFGRALACLLFTCGNTWLVGNWFDGCVRARYK